MKLYAQVGVVPFDNALIFVSRVGKVAQAQCLGYTGGIYNKGATVTTSSIYVGNKTTNLKPWYLSDSYLQGMHTYLYS